jgi:pimeloyl-ACP methyl ester carboxylesterase
MSIADKGAKKTPWWRPVLRIIRSLAVVYLLVMVCMMFLEDSLIFFPSRYPAGNWKPWGLEFEDAWFQAANGTKLHGWYVPHEKKWADRPKGDSPISVDTKIGTVPDAKIGTVPQAILFCHGNAGNVTDRADILETIHNNTDASILIFDYRGYGRSEGKPSEKGVLADARAAREWLAKRENITEKDIVLMGESLGGAVAVDLAARDGAKGLVLISTFSSLPEVAAYHYPFLPVRLMMRTRLDAVGQIANYKGPLFQMHGKIDQIVPFKFGKKLFDAANEPKQLLEFANHDHNDLPPAEFYEALQKFLQKLQ